MLQNHTPIGLGNVIGSSISNILGGLGVAMLMHSDMTFAACAKFYAGASFIAASVFLVLGSTSSLDFTGGIFFMVFFSVYIAAVGGAIYEGFLTLPDEEDESFIITAGAVTIPSPPALGLLDDRLLQSPMPQVLVSNPDDLECQRHLAPQLKISIYTSTAEVDPGACTPLLRPLEPIMSLPSRAASIVSRAKSMLKISRPPSRYSMGTLSDAETQNISYNIVKLVFGFIALFISGFVLSYTASNLAAQMNVGGTVFGLTIISIFSTLPEKFISIIVGLEGNSSLLVASIGGANVFLLTLCLGILFMSGGEGNIDARLAATLLPFEIWTTWVCSLLLLIIVWCGGRRWMGAMLLLLYAGFNWAELTVFKR